MEIDEAMGTTSMNWIFLLYCGWALLLLIYGATQVLRSGLSDLAGEAYPLLLSAFFATHLVLAVTGGVFSWLSQARGLKWASWCFVVLCVWGAGDAVWSGIRFPSDEHVLEWFRLMVIPGGWALLGALE